MPIEARREFLQRLGLPALKQKSVPRPFAPPQQAVAEAGASSDRPVLALIATRSHLPYADVAVREFLAHHPEFRVVLLLVDGTEEDRHLLPDVEIMLLADIALVDAGWLIAKLNAAELANALKPSLLINLSANARRVVYLDCDIAVFARFHTLLAALENADLVLIPHMMALFPRPEEQWRHPNNADIFNAGLINAGCFGINLQKSGKFLEFWRDANLLHAWSADGGRQTDQQFLNWALIICDNVHVLRDRSYNVAYWNLHERSLRLVSPPEAEPVFEVDGAPLTFFHFSGFDPHDILSLSKHDQRYSVYILPSVAVILEWYSEKVLSSALAGFASEQYQFGTLANGVELNEFIRNILKRYEAHMPRFDTSTREGADALCATLMAPMPATGTRLPLIAAVIYQMRPDLRDAYARAETDLEPLGFYRWFCRHAGEEYEIEPLISRFRRVLESDSLAGFAAEAQELMPDAAKDLKILGADRQLAAAELRMAGRSDMANSLLACEPEWFYFSEFSAILAVYANRTDLREFYPDPFGRSHTDFLRWLRDHGPDEHGISPVAIETFAQASAAQVLARIFSFLSRREDLAAVAVEDMLSDRPDRLVQALLRSAGDGLEYDLADVEVFCFLHGHCRGVLVPLYLELPPVRRQPVSSRTQNGRRALLPVPFDQDWVLAGCRLHEACFSPAEVALEQEVRQLRGSLSGAGQNVISVIRASRLDVSASKLARVASARARGNGNLGQTPAPSDMGGLNLFGYFLTNTGVGESSRGLARVLSSVARVRKIQQFTAHIERATKLEELFAHCDHYADTNVFVSYPHAAEDLLGLLPPEYTERRRNIIHLAWEQRDWNTHWRSIFGRYDEIWSISEFAAQSFREMFGPEKVRVVPNVLLTEDFPSVEEYAAPRFKRPVFRFLYVFDANSSMERKNPEAVVEAFSVAFSASSLASEVELVLRINNLHRAEHAARVANLRRMADASGLKVKFDGRELPRRDVLELIASADCYVSLHRAEGFGYTMAEAMYLGVPVIASGYSGNLEYMTPKNSFLVPCREKLVEFADGPFQRGSVWGDPDIDAAAHFMQTLVMNRSVAREVGLAGADSVRQLLLPDVVAGRLRTILRPGDLLRTAN